MTVSASPSIASPPPPTSPGQSSSSATPSVYAGHSRHHSRPSFAIGYSQPPPSRVSALASPNHGHSDPNPSTAGGVSSLSIKRPIVSFSSVPNPAIAVPVTHQPSTGKQHFVAPAHPQSHHLHTLPPREKNTRTLILDHTAWRHGRTRFAQGRCELGMKVGLKGENKPVAGEASSLGSSSSHRRTGFYIGSTHDSTSSLRREPSDVELASSDEEDGEPEPRGSDGESVRALAYGRRSREKRKLDDNTGDMMDVDTDNELSMENDSDVDHSEKTLPANSREPSLAPSLAAQATGIEKVLYAMLAQPPSSPPRSPSPPPYALHSSHANSQHYRPPPSSQRSTAPPPKDPARLLPNGLRLRLVLLALVNDLFERPPPLSQDESPSTSSNNSTPKAVPSDPSKQTPARNGQGSLPPLPPPSIPPPETLPIELTTLAQVSSQPFHSLPMTLPSFHTLTMPSLSSAGSAVSTISPMSATSHNISPSTPQASSWAIAGSGKDAQTRRPPPVFTWGRPSTGPVSPASPIPPSPYSTTPFGSQKQIQESERQSTVSPAPQAFSRFQGGTSSAAARALPSSWKGSTPKIIPDKSAGPGVLVKHARGRSRELYLAGCYSNPSSSTYGAPATSFQSNVPTFGSGTAPTPAPAFPLKKLKTLCPRHLREKCTICTSGVVVRGGPSTRIGEGLLKKQGSLFALGAEHADTMRSSGSVLADLIPRFLRLSALVAMELDREARGEEPEANEGPEDDKSEALSASPISPTTRAFSHAQPTRTWFALLCGLLTRAVLEGYVARGWKGPEYVEVLMGVGLGIKGIGTRQSTTAIGGNTAVQDIPDVKEDTNEFEPDEMPRLVDATKVLFNGLVQDVSISPGTKDKATRSAEEEYVVEMEERLSEFLIVPHATPDLATHLTRLSDKYPAEPVERAALRFCEAVAKWRGKPELEMYKKLHVCSSKSKSSTPAPLSIDVLLASTPTPVPCPPSIDKYFRVPLPSPSQLASRHHRALKRQRSMDGEEREPKKEKVEAIDIDLDKKDEAMPESDGEWVGPYGV
ncbi:hypothetical protein K439DRAFT_668773 [Ramaria rubella]|nr:hypothetical protein K439DRAFT_668773 [Ramaria rubella]